jgi:hypothetical protein
MQNYTSYRFNFKKHHIFVLFCYILFSVLLPIACIVIAGGDYADCDNHKVIGLKAYIIFGAVIQFINIFVMLTIGFIMLIDSYCVNCDNTQCCGDRINNGSTCCWCSHNVFVKTCRVLTIVHSTFYFCVALVGIIAIVRDSLPCAVHAQPLFAMASIVDIYYIGSIVANVYFFFMYMRLN